MKVRILKDIVSVHGTFRPRQVVDLPDNVAEVWLKKGELITPVAAPGKPEAIPEGMFWCDKHETLHRLDSSTGKKCFKRIEAETKEAEEAEEKARQDAEAAEAEAKAKAEAEAEEEAKRTAEEAEAAEQE